MTTVEQNAAKAAQPASGIVKAIRTINDIEMKAGQALMFGIIVLVFLASALRWFNYPLVWSVDMAQLLFLWACFFGADQALIRKKHIGVDMLTRKFPPPVQRALLIVTYLLTIGFFLIMLVYGIELCAESRYRRFAGMDVTYLWATLSAPVGSLLLLKTLLVLLAEQFGLISFSQDEIAPSAAAEEAPQP